MESSVGTKRTTAKETDIKNDVINFNQETRNYTCVRNFAEIFKTLISTMGDGEGFFFVIMN